MEVLPAVSNRALVPELQAGSCPGGEAGMAHFLPSWYRFYRVLRASWYKFYWKQLLSPVTGLGEGTGAFAVQVLPNIIRNRKPLQKV